MKSNVMKYSVTSHKIHGSGRSRVAVAVFVFWGRSQKYGGMLSWRSDEFG